MKQQVQLTESKAQRWRALAILEDGGEALLCLGSSIVQVRDHYHEPWYDLFPDQVRRGVSDIELQKWSGTADRGEWETQSSLPIPPIRRPAAVPA